MASVKDGPVVRMMVEENEWLKFKALVKGKNKTVREVLTDYIHHEIVKQADRKLQEES